MRVQNEYVKINTGTKEYTLKNYIYDSYLKLFSDRQKNTFILDGLTEYVETDLLICYIKVDTPLENYKTASIEEFDFSIPRKNVGTTGQKNGTSTIYNYSSYVKNMFNNIDLTEYDGKKITAGVTRWRDTTAICELYACLDTNYYSIYIDASKELNITRKDNIISNAICDGYEYPLHLSPVLERLSEESDKYKGARGRIRSVLYSVGFGGSIGKMKQEFRIGDDAKIETINDTSYGIALKNSIEIPIYPKSIMRPSIGKYPLEPKYNITIYPKEKGLYASSYNYPTKAGYTYIIFKYRLYYNILNEIFYLNEFYTMSYSYNPKGIFTIKNTIERS